jgi:tetratricopeptide (TPR) repeat protein
MQKLLIVVYVVMAASLNAFSQNCLDTAREVRPNLPAEAVKSYEAKLVEARAQVQLTPESADAILWLGRRTAYPGDYKEAIKIFTAGMAKFPKDARFYRHRGHRYITLRCFDDAIRDLEKAAKLIKGKPDEIEPDGLPNARNIPTSTLQSNIWYHLGLAYYLRGDFKRALKAYDECVKVSKNPDMLVATVHWLCMTARRLGDEKRAAKALALVPGDPEIIENADYYRLIKLYQGKTKVEDIAGELGEANTLGNASLGYGLGNWYLYNGRPVEAKRVFETIAAGNQWASFGFIGAEADLKRLKP